MRLDIKALVLASGIIWGGMLLLTGLLNLIWSGYASAFLQVFASVYPGYDASGSAGDLLVGTLYALVDGAAFGLFFGWLYNAFAAKKRAA
jgi:hypothetical protein